jgi:hypothetical protein
MSEEHHYRREGDKMWKKIVLWSTLIGGIAALPVALAFIWNMNTSIVHAKDSVASIPTSAQQESGCYTAKIDIDPSTLVSPYCGFTDQEEIVLYSGTSIIALGCGSIASMYTTVQVSLQASGGVITATAVNSYGTVTATASDSAYSSFSYVGLSSTNGEGATRVTRFNNVLLQ